MSSLLSFLSGILFDALPLVPLVIAQVWTLRFQKVVDLSLASSFALAGGVSAAMLVSGQPFWLAILGGLLVGSICGLFMGASVNFLKLDPLIAGVLNLFLFYAVSLKITEGTIRVPDLTNPIEGLRESLHSWHQLPEISIYLFIAFMVVFLSRFVLESEWGCAFRALEDAGGGGQFLDSLGIRPSRLSMSGFGIAGILAALSGVVVLLRDGQTTSSLGLDSLIEVVPAYLLGVALFEKKPILKKNNKTASAWGIWKEGLLSLNTGKNFSSAAAAFGGVICFFFVVNIVFRLTSSEWLPRVLLSAVLFLLLGLEPFLRDRATQHKQGRATTIAGVDEPLEIKDLSIKFPTVDGVRVVVDSASLTCGPGEVILLRGGNGVGKTSFLRALSGLIDCDGQFSIPAIHAQREAERKHLVAYSAQKLEESTSDTLSVEEHLVLAKLGRKISIVRPWKKAAVRGVGEDIYPQMNKLRHALMGWLSGGERRNITLSILAVRTNLPRVVAFDEPFAYLDSWGVEFCKGIIEKFAAEGRIVLLVDHENIVQAGRVVDYLWDSSVRTDKKSVL